MKITRMLSALAQPTRLEIFLAIAGSRPGLTSTQVADATKTMPNNTSVHLSVLRNAGLVSSIRRGRSITYKAERDALQSVADFLRAAAS